MTKIISWNVNSIRSRINALLEYIKEHEPDVFLLQEIKCQDFQFPRQDIEEMGYNIVLHGQKSYNGVAILSRFPILETIDQWKQSEGEEQARYIEATLHTGKKDILRVASVYVPNGASPDSPNFQYKLRFFEDLFAHAKKTLAYEENFVLGGDFNIAPEDIDVWDPIALKNTICFHPEEKKHYQSLLHLGLTDALRVLHPGEKIYSWWDYRGNGFKNNNGMRIDHFLLSPEASDKAIACDVDKDYRAKPSPSDHAPLRLTLAL